MKKTMKFSLVAILTFIYTSNSYSADYKKAAKAADGNDTYYIDMEKLKKHDGYVDVAILTNYENEEAIENIKFRSGLDDVTFNCKNQTFTTNNVTYYELNDLEGKKVLYLTQPGLEKNKKLDDVGIGIGLYKFACDANFRQEIINFYAIKK